MHVRTREFVPTTSRTPPLTYRRQMTYKFLNTIIDDLVGGWLGLWTRTAVLD